MRRQFATFRLDQWLLGVDLLLVREINPQMDVTPVPLAPPFVRGLINLRGQIVTVLDLGIRLGLSARTITESSHVVILKTNDELGAVRMQTGRAALKGASEVVGLLVDAIGDVVEEEEEFIEPPPANVGEMERRFLAGVVKLRDELMVILETNEVLRKEQSAA